MPKPKVPQISMCTTSESEVTGNMKGFFRLRKCATLATVMMLAWSGASSSNSRSYCQGFQLYQSHHRQDFLSRRSRRRTLSFPLYSSNDSNQGDKKDPLVPEANPEFDTSSKSLAGVSYKSVLEGLHVLFPPHELEQRNAQSRTDGYWPYIQTGQDPPPSLTYGEFDFYFFAQLLDRARLYYYYSSDETASANDEMDWKNKVFVDIGSGTGRLVLAAAALHPTWNVCRGIELLPTIHNQAQTNRDACRISTTDNDPDSTNSPILALTTPLEDVPLPMAPVELVCGSLDDPYVYFGDADLIFVFSSCMTQDLLTNLASAVGRQCRPGTIIITTEYMLPLTGSIGPVKNDDRFPTGTFSLGLVEKIDGWCWLTGGTSTAFIHRVQSSLWRPHQGPLQRPERSLQDQAFDVAMALEAGELTDPRRFLRNVYNNMVFQGFPESFLPKLDNI